MPAHIMIFDDDQDTLDMYAMVLDFEGYTTFIQDMPILEEAEIEQIAPDLIILDWLYGHEERGYDMLIKLRGFSQTATTPIIVCTASGEPRMDKYAEMFQAKHVDLIHKPFDLEHLNDVITMRLEQKPGMPLGG